MAGDLSKTGTNVKKRILRVDKRRELDYACRFDNILAGCNILMDISPQTCNQTTKRKDNGGLEEEGKERRDINNADFLIISNAGRSSCVRGSAQPAMQNLPQKCGKK